jgi:hypothetical protein
VQNGQSRTRFIGARSNKTRAVKFENIRDSGCRKYFHAHIAPQTRT